MRFKRIMLLIHHELFSFLVFSIAFPCVFLLIFVRQKNLLGFYVWLVFFFGLPIYFLSDLSFSFKEMRWAFHDFMDFVHVLFDKNCTYIAVIYFIGNRML